MAGRDASAPGIEAGGADRPPFPGWRRGGWIVAPAVAVASVGAITAAGLAVSNIVLLNNLSMLYLAAVIVSAVAAGGVSALLAAVLSFLAYNFFFIEPRGSFTVAQAEELLALVMFVVVAIVTGSLAAQMRAKAAAAQAEAEASNELYAFSRSLSGALSLDAVAEAIVGKLAAIGDGHAVLLLPDAAGRLTVQAASPPGSRPTDEEMRAAEQVFGARAQEDGAPQPGPPVMAMRSGARKLGVVVLGTAARRGPTIDRERHVRALVEQAAVAIDRALWVRESADAAVAREGQRLQSALLSSLSHDLRTPLATITGAATSLLQLGEKMDEATRQDLLESIAEDAGRLNRFVGNLFDMTRIESGALKVRREAFDLGEAAARASRRVQEIHTGLKVDLNLGGDLPSVSGDPLLTEQALFNILDNARKYGGVERPVAVRASAEHDTVRLSVTDDGPGIPRDDLQRIFEKFYRRGKGDGRSAGTGLGLSIARGFISAMGGSIAAESPASGRRGTRFTITLPVARA